MYIKTSFVIFFDSQHRLLLQDRHSISKHGEEWGFFGGQVEEGESFKDAAHREIKEELNYDVKDLLQIDEFNHSINGKNYHEVLWMIQLPEDYQKIFTVLEGDGMKLFSFEEVSRLKLLPIDQPIIKAAKKYLLSIF